MSDDGPADLMKIGKHVDEFIEEMADGSDTLDMGDAMYARWFLMHARLPAFMQFQFAKWIEPYQLFCTYEGKRYRCTGASRLGDVWLTADFKRKTGYELRVDLSKCTLWSDKP